MNNSHQTLVCLSGFIDVPDDQLIAVRAALPTHISLTLAEPGCLQFSVEEDSQIQGRFNVFEVFEDQAAFEAHQVRTKASDWFVLTQGITREYHIRKATR